MVWTPVGEGPRGHYTFRAPCDLDRLVTGVLRNPGGSSRRRVSIARSAALGLSLGTVQIRGILRRRAA
jgi:hypothetical protein